MNITVAVRIFKKPLSPRDASLEARRLLSDLLSENGIRIQAPLPIRSTEHGRPFLVCPKSVPPIDFNLSHADRYVVCALCIGASASIPARVGVDLEIPRTRLNPERLARRFFHPEEISRLETNSFSVSEFLDVWTKKEAFLKLTGSGLAGNLQAVNTLDPEHLSPPVSFTSYELPCDPSARLTLCLPLGITPPDSPVFSEATEKNGVSS